MLEIIGLVALFIATSTDMYNREIPDNLSHGLIIFAFVLRTIWSFNSSSFQPLVEGLAGFGIFFLLGWLLYKTNQWGGGDAKILGGLGALMGLWTNNLFMVDFFINLMIVGALYGVIYSIYLALKNKVQVKRISRIILMLFAVLVLAGLFLHTSVRFFYFAIILISLGGYYLINFISSVQKTAMIKKVKITSLTEGDWLAEDIKVGNKIIAKNSSLTEKQLKQLMKLYKNNKIKKIKIKEGIPFLPSFFIAFILTWIFGNIILAVL